MAKSLRQPLQEKGLSGAIRKTYAPDKITVDFRFTDNTIKANVENFSEKTVVDFVATSYYKSCLTLLKKVSEYDSNDKYANMDNCAYRYLPAMYCFRHYVELRLKYLYMLYASESFNVNSHSLSELLNEIKVKGYTCDVFDEPVAYIESLEKIQNSQSGGDFYFRYLIDKNIICDDSLEIPMYDFSKIQTFIVNIEHYINQDLAKKLVSKLLNNKP